MYIDPGEEAQFLEQANILRRSGWSSEGAINEEAFRQAYVGIYRHLESTEPGVWSIATGERSISFGEEELLPGRGALVQLHHAILVPDKEVPLQDILEFREKRKDELRALRHHLEDIYQRILVAGDGALAMNTEVEKLQAAIADQIKASKETGLKFRPVSINASLNLVKGVGIAAGAFAAGLPTVASLLAGAAASISVGPGTGLSWAKATGTPFRYVSAYHAELF